MYSEKLLDHFENPRNAGELSVADTRTLVENPGCGDVLELAVAIQCGRVQQARFRAKGCVALMACSSILTEMIQGLTLDQLNAISTAEFLQHTGPLPQASGHVAEMAVQAIRQLLSNPLQCNVNLNEPHPPGAIVNT